MVDVDPKKVVVSPKSLMENSPLRDDIMELRSAVVLAVRMMSSTYKSKYAVEVPWCKMNNDESLLEAKKLMDERKVVKR
jgi:hypothetical protein